MRLILLQGKDVGVDDMASRLIRGHHATLVIEA